MRRRRFLRVVSGGILGVFLRVEEFDGDLEGGHGPDLRRAANKPLVADILMNTLDKLCDLVVERAVVRGNADIETLVGDDDFVGNCL